MLQYCVGCEREHDRSHYRWLGRDFEQADGTKLFGWICEQHFKPSLTDLPNQKLQEERKKYAKDMIPPTRQGEASREFIDLYPKQAKAMFTSDEIRKAKPVWKDIKGL
jgi:hypothetical protein